MNVSNQNIFYSPKIPHLFSGRFDPGGGLVTKTANKGESITLSVTSVNGLGTFPIWRRISNGVPTNLDSFSGQYTMTVSPSEAIDGDLYAVIQSGVRLNDNHFGIIRLIVRGK